VEQNLIQMLDSGSLEPVLSKLRDTQSHSAKREQTCVVIIAVPLTIRLNIKHYPLLVIEDLSWSSGHVFLNVIQVRHTCKT
jgi:hypothetical protein